MAHLKPLSANGQTTAALHPSPAELKVFALGSLDDERAAIIEGHVYRCDRCAELVANVPGDEFVEQLRASRLGSSADSDASESDSLQETIGLPIEDFGLAELPPAIRTHSRFEIKRLVAEGAMGRVYLAISRDTRERIALKVVRPDIANDQRKVNRFLQESRVAQKLHHPNIARVIGYEPFGNSAIIAMEFIRGHSLAQMVRQRGPLPVEEACEYLRQAAAGLVCAASQGVVHRDIKPHNLMFDAEARLVKIVDFGLGRLVDEQRSGSRLTRDGEILGTLDYISPEQAADSRTADARSDIYSLGCTLYFLLAGQPPFSGKNAVDLLLMHDTETPAPIRMLRGDVPEDIADLLDRMMQKNPALRPQSPQQVLDALAHSSIAGVAEPAIPLSQQLARTALSTLFRVLGRPAVWLPLLTCLVCLLWVLLQ